MCRGLRSPLAFSVPSRVENFSLRHKSCALHVSLYKTFCASISLQSETFEGSLERVWMPPCLGPCCILPRKKPCIALKVVLEIRAVMIAEDVDFFCWRCQCNERRKQSREAGTQSWKQHSRKSIQQLSFAASAQVNATVGPWKKRR